MKAIDWLKAFQKQHDEHGKAVYTLTELANMASQDTRSVIMSVSRLVKRGVLQRYANGRYGMKDYVRAEDLVLSIDSAAYMTGMVALYRHQLITQAPSEITCFTNHRHNKSRVRSTPLGRIVFVCVAGSVYSYPRENVLVSPEQALCDYVYLCRKRGVRPSDIVTFRNLHRLNSDELGVRLKNYPDTARREIEQLILLQAANARR
jgi:hypothetical protein